MASEDKDSITISKSNAGFPPYLDFDKLRSEGIAYLGQLSGKLWTDHNVHDPGITILETLCYALLDLGYRTNLPVEDILAANPAAAAKENNFFTPAQILSCNPLTITDYRKLLIDIPGVRNAWLVPADDIKNTCRNNNSVAGATNFTGDCAEFLNGIYHVYIETEADVDKDFDNDDLAQETADKKAFIGDITGKVKATLMAHRNLCEDVADIFILCKLPMGVCATIEINEGADAETVYVAVADRLRQFFTNVPAFYTLQQLLDKGRSMDEIFAGRPYSNHSHGFIDTAELEGISLMKEIHVSDVYNAIFEVEGVRKISGLSVENCGKQCTGTGKSNWVVRLPENHIPEFSMACSGFTFTRNGLRLPVDQSKFETQLELGWLHTGKVLYQLPSPYLDAALPQGVYHDDLDSYYSIQNDFPAVYGIGEGDLSDNTPDKRKAQALQLKAYLFFFDQVLANYLSQLKNIRQLFSFTNPADKKEQHTYFLNTIATVPELNKLLRFGTGDGNNGLGTSGSLLAFPVAKNDWQLIDTAAQQAETILSSLPAYTFTSLFGLYESTDLLRNDLVNEGETVVKTYATADGKFLYSIESSTDTFILLSKKVSNTEADALRHAASVQYAGVFENNYRSFLTAENLFTFNIELNMDTYTGYLGMLVESKELYTKRREDFLGHLLSRFAEQFTDFVLLNWKPGEENNALQTVEQYLSGYPYLSRNRGRAYDYLANGYQHNNVSGFEKKVTALAGIPASKKNNLCHFTAEPYDEAYELDFSSTGITNFKVAEKFDLMEDAIAAAAAVIKSMANKKKYTIRYLGDKKEYELLLDYGGQSPAVYNNTFNDSNAVEGLASYMAGSFAQMPAADAVAEHNWKWTVQVKNNAGAVVLHSSDAWDTKAGAESAVVKLAEKLNDSKKWKPQKDNPFNGKLFYDKVLKDTYRFIDLTAFKIDINDTVVGKPGRFSYQVLDKGANSFKLVPSIDFATAAEADAHSHRILVAAAEQSNYTITQQAGGNLFNVTVLLDAGVQAASAVDYNSEADAQKAVAEIVQVIKQHVYAANLLQTAVSWKFSYKLGHDANSSYNFLSEKAYASEKEAAAAVQLFYKHLADLRVETHKDSITLGGEKKTNTPSVIYFPAADDTARVTAAVKAAMEEQHSIARLQSITKPETLKAFVRVAGVDSFGTFVYRLVNKNSTPAVYTQSFSDEVTATANRKKIASISKKAIALIPGICLGGDIFEEWYDAAGRLWYRYQVKFYNVRGLPGRELVLFESATVFATPAEAVGSFYDNYLHVLRLASDKNNYGKSISTTPVDIDKNKSKNELVAFIPAATLKILQDSFGTAWNDKLVEIVQSYPIKIIDANSMAFASLFCTDYTKPVSNCAAGVKDWKYYFSIPIVTGGQQQAAQGWKSTDWYDTADAALEDFRYFSRLLCFTGNYFVDCGCDKTETGEAQQEKKWLYKIFIHEVLAQSVNWFQRQEDAWGVNGIEKFICAVQSGAAFKNYQRREDCCYSLYVTCGNGLLEHPCKYDGETQRDAALQSLYTELNTFVKRNTYSYTADKANIFLSDEHGQPFARVSPGTTNQADPCEQYIRLAEEITRKTGVVAYSAEGFLIYNINNGEIIIQSAVQKQTGDKAEQDAWIAAWSKTLFYWACYFPISRTRLKTSAGNMRESAGRYKYCIEVKLPTFNLCDEDAKPNEPCECDAPDGGTAYCNIAWKGTCCYNSCGEALAAWKEGIKLLMDRNNYYATFDCDCHSFGISLHTVQPALVAPQLPVVSASDIIAVNPQCYETQKDVCAAVDTAMSLINSQGMHLAEHILLRPYTQADCECRRTLHACNTNCHFPDYIVTGDDVCAAADQSICFTPGTDPYSFIATVVLPAWSSRFRDEGNRLLLENLLYREAPAHVLLRILWLKPVDFCRFEKEFNGWQKWIAGMHACNNDFSVCRFLDLLFETPYDCLPPCRDCVPCTDPGLEQPYNCGSKIRRNELSFSRADKPFLFLNQVNDTYCFDPYCEAAIVPGDLPNGGGINAPAIAKAVKPMVAASKKMTNKLSKEKVKAIVEVPQGISGKADQTAAIQNSKLKAQAINGRFSKYKTLVARVLEQTAGNAIAARTDRLLNAPQADAAKLAVLITEIIQNEKSTDKKIKHLNKKQQQDLIKAAVCFYLDKISFNGKDAASYAALQPIIKMLSKAGTDMQPVFNYWDAAEAVKVAPGIDIDFVRQLITGSKK